MSVQIGVVDTSGGSRSIYADALRRLCEKEYRDGAKIVPFISKP